MSLKKYRVRVQYDNDNLFVAHSLAGAAQMGMEQAEDLTQDGEWEVDPVEITVEYRSEAPKRRALAKLVSEFMQAEIDDGSWRDNIMDHLDVDHGIQVTAEEVEAVLLRTKEAIVKELWEPSDGDYDLNDEDYAESVKCAAMHNPDGD